MFSPEGRLCSDNDNLLRSPLTLVRHCARAGTGSETKRKRRKGWNTFLRILDADRILDHSTSEARQMKCRGLSELGVGDKSAIEPLLITT